MILESATTAQRILVAYGAVSLGFGFALGVPISRIRTGAPQAPRHLVTAHLSAIVQGAVHLALVIAVAVSTLTAWVETSAAALLVAGSALFVSGATANWLQGVGDHFAARSLGWKLLAASAFGHLPGMAIVVAGVLAALA